MSRRRIAAQWLPRQHGAWSMLLLPAVVGAWRGGFAWIHLLLTAVLFAGYFAFNDTSLMLHARPARRRGYLPAVLTYTAVTAVLGLPIIVLAPGLLVWLPPYAVLAAISLLFAWRRHDRALANDAVTMAAASLFAAVQMQAGTVPPRWDHAWAVTWWVVVAMFAYFLGTALYVKTMIRERTNIGYHRASVLYHLAWTTWWALSGSVGVPVGLPTRVALTVLFAGLTVRAWVMAGRRVRPALVGAGELLPTLLLLALTVTWS